MLTLFPIFAAMNRCAWIFPLLIAASCGGERTANTPADTALLAKGTPPQTAPSAAPQQPQSPLQSPSAADTAAPSAAADTTAKNVAPLPNNQTFTATVDGVEWSGIQVIASRVDSAIAVTAIGPNGTSLILNLGNLTSVGPLKFDAADPGQFATWINPQGVSFSTDPAGTGSVRITRIDKNRVAGTFNFTANLQGESGKVRVGNGVFNVMFGK